MSGSRRGTKTRVVPCGDGMEREGGQRIQGAGLQDIRFRHRGGNGSNVRLVHRTFGTSDDHGIIEVGMGCARFMTSMFRRVEATEGVPSNDLGGVFVFRLIHVGYKHDLLGDCPRIRGMIERRMNLGADAHPDYEDHP